MAAGSHITRKKCHVEECCRRAVGRPVSLGEEQKEKVKGIIPGGLPRSYHLFLGKEDSGWCGFAVRGNLFAGDINLSYISSFSALDPGICGAPTLILGPTWLGPKKKAISAGPLLCAGHFKLMITLDSVLWVMSPPFYRRGNWSEAQRKHRSDLGAPTSW